MLANISERETPNLEVACWNPKHSKSLNNTRRISIYLISFCSTAFCHFLASVCEVQLLLCVYSVFVSKS